ncbi:hypothetical protein F8S13_19950 [Chloroflexia bacterium SDU3-3]|nr:hypothetical protein F8S13_19950 [Chloroflexia bacterium SDU3-3]
MTKNISVCGAPCVGKTKMIQTLSCITNNKGCIISRKPWENKIGLNFNINKPYYISSISGPFLEEKDDIYKEIIDNSDAIIYMFSVDYPTPREDYSYEKWKRISFQMDKSRVNIPWVCVVNIPETILYQKSIDIIPQELRSNTIYKDVANPMDVRDILTYVIKAMM